MTETPAGLRLEETLPDALDITPAPARQDPPPELVLPRDVKSVYLGGLFFLATMVAIYFAASIILPVVLAMILKLLLQPALHPLERLHIPRALAALMVVIMVVGGMVGFGALVSTPAVTWVQKLPEGFPRFQQHIKVLTQPLAEVGGVLERAEKATQEAAQGQPTGTPSVTVKGVGIVNALAMGTFNLVVGILTTILLLFFLLASGDTFLRRVVEVLPRFKDKRQAVDIVQNIEHDISAYLVTISAINLMVGVATGAAMHFSGVGDAVLWGAAAFLLNYVPILGPLVGVCMFGLVGMLSFDTIGLALAPAGLYLLIHVIEGEFVMPLILAKRLMINPVIIILSLIFWYWMWGVAGAILAVPILAIVKIICDRITPLMAVGHFLEG